MNAPVHYLRGFVPLTLGIGLANLAAAGMYWRDAEVGDEGRVAERQNRLWWHLMGTRIATVTVPEKRGRPRCCSAPTRWSPPACAAVV